MRLARDRRRLAMSVLFGTRRLRENHEMIVRHSVSLRLLSIRHRHLALLSRLMLPIRS